jgi:GTPase SAR1 family protein
VLVVYDVSSRKSFEKIAYWMTQIDNNAESGIQRILIANKCDLTYEREVSKKEGEELAKRYNIKYIETSAKTDKNIGTAFENLALDVFLAVKDKRIPADSDGSKGVKVGDYYVEEPKLVGTLKASNERGEPRVERMKIKNLNRKKKGKGAEKNQEKSGCCN